MRIPILIAYLVLSAASYGASIGDTYERVVAEKGKPKSEITAGPVRILNYEDSTLKLRDDVVVSIAVVNRAQQASSRLTSAPTLSPAAQLEAAKKESSEAIAKVLKIVNQPARAMKRTPEMRVWEYEYWFHPGATKPAFDTVDVKASQQLDYEGEDYVCLKDHPDLVWAGADLEFNSMTKFFYVDRSLPKKKLTADEMAEINRLYRIIGHCEKTLNRGGIELKPSS